MFPIFNPRIDAVSVLDLDRIGFLIVAGVFTTNLWRDRSALPQLGRVELAMTVYLGIAVVSWLTHLAGKDSVALKRDVGLLLTCVIMPFTAFLVARHSSWSVRQRVQSVKAVLILAGSCLIIIGIIQATVDWSFLVAPEHQDMHHERARGALPNALPYALVLSLLLVNTVALWTSSANREPDRVLPAWLRAVLVVGLLECLVFSGMRIVWLAVPLALLFVARVTPALRRPAVSIAAGVVLVVGLGALRLDLGRFAGPHGAVRQPLGDVGDRISDREPLYNRVAVYMTALNMIAHRPLFGYGFGGRTFERYKGEFYTSCCGVSPQWAEICAVPHNDLLNQLVLLGLVGLALFLWLMREIWRLLGMARSTTGVDQLARLAACAQAGFIVLAVTGMLHDVMQIAPVLLLFCFLAGLAAPAQAPGEFE